MGAWHPLFRDARRLPCQVTLRSRRPLPRFELTLTLSGAVRLQPFFDDNPMGIYEKILAAKIAFPPHIDSLTKDLIRRLLTVDRSKRLGNLRGGAMDVMMHPWFSGVDWGSLERRQIRAPIIPPVADVGESSPGFLSTRLPSSAI